MKIIKLNSGFTIIEIMVAIAILIILSAIGWSGLQDYKINQLQKAGSETVLSILNEARVMAQSGDSARSYSVTINTTNKTLTLFKVTTDPGDTAYSKTETLDSKISLVLQITGGTDTITFDRFTGSTDNPATITVSIAKTNGATLSSTIRVYKTGLATID